LHFEHRIETSASPESVWDFLWQVDQVGACLPGCKAVETIEPMSRYMATIEERVGPFKALFNWEITVEERDPMQAIRLSARGQDPKLGATARAGMTVRLAPNDRSGTAIDVDTELLITGKVATLGQVVIKRKADQVVRDFAEALRAQLENSRT
jgi:uncharacterized protein